MKPIRNIVIIVASAAAISAVSASLASVFAMVVKTSTGGIGVVGSGSGGGGGGGGGGGPVIPPTSDAVTTTPANGCEGPTGPFVEPFNPQLNTDINTYRQSVGLPAISNSPVNLSTFAQTRVNDMQGNNYVGVINSSGQTIAMELAAGGVPFTNASLLVLKGCVGTPADFQNVVADWASDPTAVATLNYPGWTSVGFSWIFFVTNPTPGNPNYGPATNTGYWLIAAVFTQ